MLTAASPKIPTRRTARLKQRLISVLTPPTGFIHSPGVRRIASVTRYPEPLKTDPDEDRAGAGNDTETASVITSPKRRLQLNRGHWTVDNMHHRQRDGVFGEDAGLTRTDSGPANRARLNHIALARMFADRRGTGNLAGTRRRTRPVRRIRLSAARPSRNAGRARLRSCPRP